MLTTDLLKANEPLKDLTDEQLTIIVALSKRDEEQVIGKRIGEIYSDLDKDILEATGINKGGPAEKTYAYLKRAFKERIDSVDVKVYEDQIEALKKEKDDLLKSGNDKKVAEIQKQLNEKIDRIEKMKDAHKTALEAKDKEISDQLKTMDDFKVDSQFSSTISGMTFNDAVPEAARKAMINQVQAHVKSLPREWVDGKLVFKDENGEILRDKTTLEPLGMEAIATQRLQPIMKEERPGGGAGGKGKGRPQGTTIDLSNVNNKVELTKAIRDHLLEQGIAVSSSEFSEKEAELYNEHSDIL